MKTIYFLVLFSLAITSCRDNTPVNLDNEKAVREALHATWELAYMETRASRSKVPEEMVTEVVYRKDGTFSSRKKKDAIVTTGRWNYVAANRAFEHMSSAGSGTSRILQLTGSELVVSGYIYLNDMVTDSIVETYYRR